VASVRSCQKLPPCLIKLVPAGSKTDLRLAKAKPISNGHSASRIAHLRSGEKPAQLQLERGMRICERNNSADTKVSEEGGGRRCSRHQSRDSPAARGEDHGEAGCAPAAHGGPQWSRSPPAACGRDPTLEQVDAQRRL